MRASLVIIAVATAWVIGMPSAYAADIVVNPDASTIFLLQCEFAKTDPPYDAITHWGSTVQSSDEFHRPEAIKEAGASLHAKAGGLQGVNKIIVNLGSRFSEYDAQYGEYDFDINDGSYITYSAFGRQVRIALTNGTRAQTWKLTPKEAEDALRKNKGDRLATLVLTLMLLDSPPAVDSEPMVLNARVIGYDVLTGYSHVKLGSVVVDNAQ
jgi:hypothetical protein